LVTAGTATWGTQASFGVSANGFTAFFSTSESYSVSGAPITQVSRDHDPGGFIKWHMVANTSPVKNSGYAYYLTILVITKPHEYTPWGNIELEIIVHSKWHHGWWDYPEYTTKIADVFSDTSIAYENEDGGGGGCPYVSVWNGTQFVTDNNILPKSIYSQNRVVIDRYVLQNSPAIIANNNTYGLRLFESNKNTSFFDRVKLFAVDHRPSINVALDQYGRIRTYRAPTPPKEAIDSNGNSVLSEIRDWDDGKYVEGNAGYWVVLNFGKVHNRGPKLVLRADYLLVKFSIKVSILIDGKWVWIADIHPRHYWSVDIVDLSELMPFVRGELLIRLYFTGCHKIDFVGLEAKSDAEVVVHELPLVLAKEYTIDKQFTKTVTLLLLEQDDIFVKMDSNQAILLWFLNVPKRYGLTRTFIFEVVGYYTYIL